MKSALAEPSITYLTVLQLQVQQSSLQRCSCTENVFSITHLNQNICKSHPVSTAKYNLLSNFSPTKTRKRPPLYPSTLPDPLFPLEPPVTQYFPTRWYVPKRENSAHSKPAVSSFQLQEYLPLCSLTGR